MRHISLCETSGNETFIISHCISSRLACPLFNSPPKGGDKRLVLLSLAFLAPWLPLWGSCRRLRGLLLRYASLCETSGNEIPIVSPLISYRLACPLFYSPPKGGDKRLVLLSLAFLAPWLPLWGSCRRLRELLLRRISLCETSRNETLIISHLISYRLAYPLALRDFPPKGAARFRYKPSSPKRRRAASASLARISFSRYIPRQCIQRLREGTIGMFFYDEPAVVSGFGD